jgi:uncharacterized membrane protein HdeD (DUF308 family)
MIIGLILVLFPNEAGDYFVITIGIVFLVPALISIITYYSQRADERIPFPLSGIGSLLFGLWLVIMPTFFADFLTFIFGFIIVIEGVQQIASLIAARHWMSVKKRYYVVPMLVAISGLITIINPMGVRSTAFIIIGITNLIYAISELIHWFVFIRCRPKNFINSDEKEIFEDTKVID